MHLLRDLSERRAFPEFTDLHRSLSSLMGSDDPTAAERVGCSISGIEVSGPHARRPDAIVVRRISARPSSPETVFHGITGLILYGTI